MGVLLAPGQSAATLPPGATAPNVAAVDPNAGKSGRYIDTPTSTIRPFQPGAWKTDANGINQFTPAPSEPAVLSSGTINDEIIPANNKKLDDFSKKGTYVGADNNVYYSDGSAVPAPLDAQYNENSKTWNSGGQTYTAAPQYVTGNDEDSQQINTLLTSMKSSLDSSTLAQINSIQQQYDLLKQQQQDANTRADKTRERTLLTGGGARYAQANSAGVTLAQTSYGLQQIQKLDADENAAIATARQAQQSGNMKLMDSALNIVEQTRKDKQAAAQKVADQLSKANADALKKKGDATRDEVIAGLMAQGVTDPAKIQDYLNKYDDGSRTGGEFTVDEIKKTIDDLTPKVAKADALYKFTNDDVGKLFSVGINAGTIKALSDYYNGVGDGAELNTLTSAQQAKVNEVLSGKKPAATTTTDAGTPGGQAAVTWDEFIKEAQNQTQMDINPDSELYKQLKGQYDQTYGSSTVALGKLTPTEKNNLARAGLGGTSTAVQAYFLGTDAAFQDEWAREQAAGKTGPITLDNLTKSYDAWKSKKSEGNSNINALVQALKNGS